MKAYYVYITSNIPRTVLYIGVTNNLTRRALEHKSGTVPGFTDKYRCCDLIYFEDTSSIAAAIEREKQLKKWSRNKKQQLILKQNPALIDLSASLEMT